MRRHLAYLKYVLRHKWYVFRAGCTLEIPLLALLHDNSKFLPDEWRWYARHFYTEAGEKRTKLNSDGFYRDVPDDTKFDRALLLHIRRNKHHPEHWLHISGAACRCLGSMWASGRRTDVLLKYNGGARCMTCLSDVDTSNMRVRADEMPLKYRLEMIADWVGAGLAQGTPDVLAWYASRGKNHRFGPETRTWVEEALKYREAQA